MLWAALHLKHFVRAFAAKQTRGEHGWTHSVAKGGICIECDMYD